MSIDQSLSLSLRLDRLSKVVSFVRNSTHHQQYEQIREQSNKRVLCCVIQEVSSYKRNAMPEVMVIVKEYDVEDEGQRRVIRNFSDIKESALFTMNLKLDPRVRWTYLVDRNCNRRTMNHFINGPEFHDFFRDFAVASSLLTYRDVRSIGTGEETRIAVFFRNIFQKLDQSGFPGARGRSINFWSGSKGRDKAHQVSSLSDSDLPCICVGFDVCGLIQQMEQRHDVNILTSMLPDALSTVYAAEAHGIVPVFMSSDKHSETSALQAGNNFWNAELPTLQRLRHAGTVQRIVIYFYDRGTDTWIQRDFQADLDQLPLTRRNAYLGPSIPDPDHSLYVTSVGGSRTYQEWTQSSPRPIITMGVVNRCLQRWIEKTRRRAG